MTYRWIGPALMGLLCVAAHADVQVSFAHPEQFSDIKDNDGFRRPDVLKDIEAHLVAQAGKLLPGRAVRIHVTDVDLAGEIEPFGGRGQWLRVLREITPPAVELNFELWEGGALVRQGSARLRDLNYQTGFNAYYSGDTLRHEKRMLDRWIQREFAPSVAARIR